MAKRKNARKRVPSSTEYLVSSVILGIIGVPLLLLAVASFSLSVSTGVLLLIWAGIIVALMANCIIAYKKIKSRKSAKSTTQRASSGASQPSKSPYPVPLPLPLQDGPVLESTPVENAIDITVPEIFDGCPLAYHYSKVPSANLDYDLAMRIAGSNQWEVQAEIRDGRPVILYDGQKLAVLADQARENMLSDWIRNGEPYKIYLETIHTDEKTAVFFLAFYRSLDRQMRGREKTVVKLTNCYSNEKQEWIALLSEGDELELSDDYTDDFTDCVNVLDSGTEIGRLPKRTAEKFLENGCAGCFVDHVDLDVEKDKYIPYVVIYW